MATDSKASSEREAPGGRQRFKATGDAVGDGDVIRSTHSTEFADATDRCRLDAPQKWPITDITLFEYP